MSMWTHVCGAVYFDDYAFISNNKPTSIEQTITDRLKNKLPEGSEGPLSFRVIRGDEAGSHSLPEVGWETSCYRWVVVVWGDLRDYDKGWIISEWLKDAFNLENISVRDACIHIESEDGRKLFMHTEDFEKEEPKL